MRPTHYVVAGLLAAAAIVTLGAHQAAAQQSRSENDANEVQVQMTVSAEARHGMEVPPVMKEDVVVEEQHDRDKVTKWVPAQGAKAGMDLLVLLDDSSSITLGTQLDDIRAFMRAQPPTTLIGVGYMQNGTVQMTQNFTQDHASAAKALRLPLGAFAGVEASPYFSLSEAIKRWPANPERPRRVVLMVTDGVDEFYGGGPVDPYVGSAIADAQSAGVLVYSIYTRGSGHAGHSFFLNYWGQNYLSEVAEKTGAESYWIGFGGAVDFTPYLDELSHQLQHQYLLTFIPKPEKKAGMQRVRVATELSGVELIAPESVFVPATAD